MQFSYDWLKAWANTQLAPDDLAYLLTMAGLEVEENNPVVPEFTGVVVAEVKKIAAHPDADRLCVVQVAVGTGELTQIVCGAPNVTVGMKVPCALAGALLPNDFVIKPTKMRGVESNGMLCSAKELGLPDGVDGLLELPFDAPVGQNIREYLSLDDRLFTLKITPNRADCLSIKGLAREVGALTQIEVNPVACAPVSVTIDDVLPVTIKENQACGRFVGRVIKGVNAKAQTPAWIKARLERSGLRSVSAIVDITNYVLLELGQPMHAFDLAKISGSLHVRLAFAGETLLCLNEKEVTLSADTLVIADEQQVLSMAGFMGGEHSAVGNDTQDIFLESAYFSPQIIAGKSRSYGFGSDSAFRFERGVDFTGQQQALERVSQLILDICGGNAGPLVEEIGELPKRPDVSVRLARIDKILGIHVAETQVVDILQRLGLNPKKADAAYCVQVPSFRFDLNIEVDLIEEVGRVYGYENIPDDTLKGSLHMLKLPETLKSRLGVYKSMALYDYQEVVNYAFVNKAWESDFADNQKPIFLKNPIASQMSVMRSTLLGGLVAVLQNNLKRQQNRVRIFEVARIFKKTADNQFEQLEKLAALAYGRRLPEQWGAVEQQVDFFDVKADVERLFAPKVLHFVAAKHPALHPGRTAEIYENQKRVGILGEIHPQWVQKYGLNQAPVVFELDFHTILQKNKVEFKPISKFQSVRRDLAFVLPEHIEAATLLDALEQERSDLVQSIALFDVYQGIGVGEGKRSLAIKVLLQAQDRTLSDHDVEAVIHNMLQSAENLGAVLRT